MPKYYVKSGQLERIVCAATPAKAVKSIFDLDKEINVQSLDHFIYVDEAGFRETSATHSFTTSRVLKMLGWIIE